MTNFARKSDGRRIFTDAFKRRQIGRIWRGELTLADLSRRLGIAASVLQRWKRLLPQGARSMIAATEHMTPARESRATRYIHELQLLVGKQTVELELLRADLDALGSGRRSLGASRR